MYAGIINKWLDAISSTTIDRIKPIQLQKILAEGINTSSQSFTDKIYNCLNGIFKTAVSNGVISVNPMRDVSKPSNGKKSKREALTNEECDVLVEVCRSDSKGLLPLIQLYAGLRVGEALALTWGDVSNSHISVNKTVVKRTNSNQSEIKSSPKSEAGVRMVPILPIVEECIERVNPGRNLPNDSFIFTQKDGKLCSGISQRRTWERIEKAFQVLWYEKHGTEARHITSHMLRHTYITILYNAGVDVKTAQKWAGHATLSMTLDVYTHLSDEKILEAETKLKEYCSQNAT
jgi:integrase